MRRFLQSIAALSAKHPLAVLIAVSLITGLMAFSMTRLRIGNDPQEFLPAHEKVDAHEEIEERFGSASFSHTLYVRFSPRGDGSIESPDAIQEMEDVLNALRAVPGVTGAQGIPDFVKTIHAGLHGGDADYGNLPLEGCELGYPFADVIRMSFQRVTLLKGFTSPEGTAIAFAAVDVDADLVRVSQQAEDALEALDGSALDVGFLSYGASITVFDSVTRGDVRLFGPFTAVIAALVLVWIFRIRSWKILILLLALLLALSTVALAPMMSTAGAKILQLASGFLLIAAMVLVTKRVSILHVVAWGGLGLLLILLQNGWGLSIVGLATVAFSFRRLSNLYLPLLIVILTAVWTFGLLGLVGVPLNFLTIAVLPLLLGVGIDDAIHILHRYDGERRAGASGEAAIDTAVTRTGRALLLTTLTTVVGFSALLVSRSPTIQHFGLLASFAMLTSFIVTMAVIPASKHLLREPAEEPGGLPRDETFLGRILRRYVEALSRSRAVPVVIVLAAVIGIGAFVIGYDIDLYSFDLRRMLPANYPIVRLYNDINQEFRVYDEVNILITGEIARLDVIRAMTETAPTALSTSPYIRRVTSIAQVVDDARRANPTLDVQFMGTFVEVGADEAYKSLFDDILSRPDLRNRAEGYVSRDEQGDYTTAVIRADVLRYHDHERAAIVAADVTARVAPLVEELERLDLQVVVTGSPYLTDISLRSLREGFFISMGVAFALCFLVIALVFRSIRWGAISVVPMALVMGLELATIKLLGIRISASTAMVAAIAIGVGVDYAIHLVQRFREERDLGLATSRTGEALFSGCATTIAAFFALILGQILWNRDFGLLAGAAVLYAFAVTVLILPALLNLVIKPLNRRSDS
ncbi:RND family transporter [Candidatus Bipolaricaulota bacterium]